MASVKLRPLDLVANQRKSLSTSDSSVVRYRYNCPLFFQVTLQDLFISFLRTVYFIYFILGGVLTVGVNTRYLSLS